jgi:hypothetical protein
VLALDVPQRDVDTAEALNHHAFLAVIAQPGINHLPEMIGPQRILADQPRHHVVDHGRGDPRRAVAFTPADDAVIGFDFHHHRHARIVPGARIGERLREDRFEDVGADGCDTHGLSPSSLRAKRSNPESGRRDSLDCFVASLLAMTGKIN